MRRAGPALAVLLLAGAAASSGCVAEAIERRKPRKGPVKEVGFVDFGGGHIRYNTEGWGLWVAARRRAALRKMRRNCGKKLKPFVTDEYDREDADAVYAGEEVGATMGHGGEHFRIGQFKHMVYECRDPKAPPPGSAAPKGPAFLVVPSSAAASAPPAPTPEAAAVQSAAGETVAVSTEAAAVPAVSTSTISISTETAP